MFIKSVIGPALLTLGMFAAAPVFAAGADATIHQVYDAAEAGRFDDAQSMMDKVLHDHPNSAKAHFVEAELMAKQGHLHDAGIELNTAERLEPSLNFANPQKIHELQARISGVRPLTQSAQSVQSVQSVQSAQPGFSRQVARSGGSDVGGWVTPLIIIGLIALFFFIVRALGRRNTVVAGGGYPGYGPGATMQSYGPGMVGGQPGGGMGSGILGGLATGAAVGAGIVAGEELMHHFTDRDRNEVIYDTPQNNNRSVPDDMGGNDFGVSDSSSWDSGGGGGSDDWN
jgi:hypothetical protein